MSVKPEIQKLFSFEFIALCLIIATAFCNISVFYGFYQYLGVINIPLAWRGFLVGLEPMTSFEMLLFILPWLYVRNAYNVAIAALLLLVIVSCSYLFVTTVTAMIILRILHGAVFVLLTSSVIALMVHFIPPEKSGQGFSALAVATMIPYAVVPPLAEALLPHVRNEADIYAGVSIFSIAAILLLAGLRKRIGQTLAGLNTVLIHRPTIKEIRDNFRQRTVLILLLAMLFVYIIHATVFYFTKSLYLQTGIGNVGVFFTVSMITMIVVRLFAAFVLDRLNQPRIVMMALSLLMLCLIALPNVSALSSYYLLAMVYGSAMGIALPILNALIFSASAPALRGLNTNMTLFAMDMGYFLTPYLGNMLVSQGAGFQILFYIAAGFALMCLSLIIALASLKKEDE